MLILHKWVSNRFLLLGLIRKFDGIESVQSVESIRVNVSVDQALGASNINWNLVKHRKNLIILTLIFRTRAEICQPLLSQFIRHAVHSLKNFLLGVFQLKTLIVIRYIVGSRGASQLGGLF